MVSLSSWLQLKILGKNTKINYLWPLKLNKSKQIVEENQNLKKVPHKWVCQLAFWWALHWIQSPHSKCKVIKHWNTSSNPIFLAKGIRKRRSRGRSTRREKSHIRKGSLIIHINLQTLSSLLSYACVGQTQSSITKSWRTQLRCVPQPGKSDSTWGLNLHGLLHS